MANGWFSTKGQIVQVVLAALGCFFAGVKAWPDMKNNDLLSSGAILFYVLVTVVVLSGGILANRLHAGSGNTASAGEGAKITLQVTSLDPRSTDPAITYKAKVR